MPRQPRSAICHVACAVLAALVLVGGCRLPGRGPVSAQVLTCRQLTQRGLSAMERGDWPAAELLLSQAVAACAVDWESRRHYAEALWQRGARSEALAQLDEAIRLSSDDPALLVRAAEMHLAVGQLPAARARAEQALDLEPTRAGAWAVRGRVAQQAGDRRQALADLHRALSCDPHDRQALVDLAELYRALDQPQRALVHLQTLLDTYPGGEEPPQALYLCGLACAALGRHDDAVDHFQAAAGRGPVTPELLFRLAEAEYRAGRPAEAKAALEHALALEPRHAASQGLWARIAEHGQAEAPRGPLR